MVKGALERGQMILFHRAGGAVDAPLADGHMGLKAILRGGIAGEVLDGQNNRTLVQAVVAILIALDQSLGNIAGDIGTLAVSTGGTGPAGVRGHIDLRAVHDVQALGLHHLAVGLGHLIDHVGVAVANDSRADAQRVRVTDVDGVGVERVRNGHAALAGLVFQHLGAGVVVQSHHAGLAAHVTAVNTGGNVLFQNVAVINADGHAGQRAGHGLFTGVVVLVDLAQLQLAFGVGGLGTGGHHRAVEQGVQHKACLLIQPQMLDHILSALLRAQPPILVGGQLAAVVQILKVQAVLDDHAAGGHTDVGAVDVVEDDRLKILVNDLLALFQSVGCRDHAVLGLCPLVGAGIPCLHNVSPLSLCLPQHS